MFFLESLFASQSLLLRKSARPNVILTPSQPPRTVYAHPLSRPFGQYHCRFLHLSKVKVSLFVEFYIQGVFFDWSAPKMTKCQITCKSLQKSSKCQNFLRVCHLVIFRADQLKKPPCIWYKRTLLQKFHCQSPFTVSMTMTTWPSGKQASFKMEPGKILKKLSRHYPSLISSIVPASEDQLEHN